MKKLFVKLMAVAIAACTFTACEDVPEPYNNPYDSMKEQVPLVEVEPAGTGTAADPYNVTALIAACEGLGAGEYINNGNEVYVKGIVVETTEVSAQYGNATYYIADDLNGLLRFYVFRGKLLDGASVTSESDLKVGDKVTVCGKVFNYQDSKSGNLTLEFAQGNYLVALNSASGNGGNTEAKKVSVADFLAAAESTDTWYQLTGTISNLKDGDQYGNFDLTDETGSVYVYGLLSEKGGEKQKFQELVAKHNLKNGSTITIIGNRSSYNDKPQVKNAYFVEAGSGETPAPSGEAKGDGTQSNPYNVAALIAACNGLAAGEYINGGNEVYVSGIVVEIKELSPQYGNATYYIADDLNASDRFYVFRGKLLDGASVTSESDLKVGDKVTVCGKVFNYQDKSGNTTLEFAQGNYLVSLDGSNAGGNDNPSSGGEVSGNSISVVYADLGLSSLDSPITLSDGTTLTFSKEDGKNPPIYHEGSQIIRMYAHNSVTISANKTISSVVFNYDTYQGTAYKGNDLMYGEANGQRITPAKDDKTVTFNNVNYNTLKVVNDFDTNSGGVQFRCTGLVITYAN